MGVGFVSPLLTRFGGSCENAENRCVFRMRTLLRNRVGVGMSWDKGCKFLEMKDPSSCKYRLVSLHASMLHNTASPASIFFRIDEKPPVCRYVLQINCRNEWNEQQAGEASPHKRAYQDIDGTKLVKAHLDSSPMYINISVLFIFPPLFHGPKQPEIYSYPIHNSEV